MEGEAGAAGGLTAARRPAGFISPRIKTVEKHHPKLSGNGNLDRYDRGRRIPLFLILGGGPE